jgi:hypothetical protein
MVTTAAASCVNHRRRDKVATCGTCGNALCADCVVHTPVGVKCRSCTGVKGSAVGSGAHVSAGGTRPEASVARDGGRSRRPFVLVGVGVAALALAAFTVASRHSTSPSPDEPGAALSPTVSERTSEFVGAGGLHLGGTLTLPPATAGQANVPAVLLIPGLGAIDRDSVVAAGNPDATRDALAATLTVSALGGSEPMFKDLSQTLASAGIASFRYDERGTAASKFKPDQKLSFDDQVADARAALDFLTQRQEVGSAPIAVLGHDQGGLVAMRLAAGNPRVKAMVAVSTPGRPLADVLADDLSKSKGAAVGDEFRASVATLASTGKVPAQGTLSLFLQPLFPAGQDAYLSSIFSLDPRIEAKAVTVPALIVRGGGDQSTSTAEATSLAAVTGPAGEVVVGGSDIDRNLALPGLGHVHSNTVIEVKSNQDPDVTRRLTAWLQAKLHA